MTRVDAIFENGVLKPLQQLPFKEPQRVRLKIEASERDDIRAWLAVTERTQQGLMTRMGVFPDSTTDIAEDRMRDG